MNFVKRGFLSALVACSIAAVPFLANASTTFDFEFDDQGLVEDDGPLVGDIVGRGQFISPYNLTAGTYQLSNLTGFKVNFSFINGEVFTTADITTPLTGVAIRITDVGSGLQRLFFTEGIGPGVIGGSKGGSIDLQNGASFLSFEPSFAGGNFLYIAGDLDGRYIALSTAIPEPASITLLLLGISGIFLSRRIINGNLETR